MKNAILVGIESKNDSYDINYSLDELEKLANECDIKVVSRLTQKLDYPNKLTYLGKGKIDELLAEIHIYDADIVIFNDELTPLMLKTLNDKIDVEVTDRSLIILDIFLRHAKTNEAKLEIKLAHLRYLYPRLQSLRDGFDRQGGIGSKGPGETQLELDRRQVSNDILKAEKELEEAHKMKKLQIAHRKKENMKTVALVGYTNAGKSSTLNSIIDFTNKDSEKKVYQENKLFATLDTQTRKITYNDTSFLLTDTIGFVSKLPANLVHSFRETLIEAKEADLLIHVLDCSSKYAIEQFNITMQMLQSIGASDNKMLVLLNKSDLATTPLQINGADYISFSAKTGLNIDKVLKYITSFVNEGNITMEIMLPYSEGKLLNFIIENTHVLSKLYQDHGIYMSLQVPARYYKKLSIYEISDSNYTN